MGSILKGFICLLKCQNKSDELKLSLLWREFGRIRSERQHIVAAPYYKVGKSEAAKVFLNVAPPPSNQSKLEVEFFLRFYGVKFTVIVDEYSNKMQMCMHDGTRRTLQIPVTRKNINFKRFNSCISAKTRAYFILTRILFPASVWLTLIKNRKNYEFGVPFCTFRADMLFGRWLVEGGGLETKPNIGI